jgi:hypothetical protein
VGRLPGQGAALSAGGAWSAIWAGADEPASWDAPGDVGPAVPAADVVFQTLGEQGPESLQDAGAIWTLDDTLDLFWALDS